MWKMTMQWQIYKIVKTCHMLHERHLFHIATSSLPLPSFLFFSSGFRSSLNFTRDSFRRCQGKVNSHMWEPNLNRGKKSVFYSITISWDVQKLKYILHKQISNSWWTKTEKKNWQFKYLLKEEERSLCIYSRAPLQQASCYVREVCIGSNMGISWDYL